MDSAMFRKLRSSFPARRPGAPRRRHVLITNDFPPKVGGIQSYLWEIYRRLPGDEVAVITTAYPGAEAFDAAAPFEIIRSPNKFLMPTFSLAAELAGLLRSMEAESAAVDPALPLGLVLPRLPVRAHLVVHGAEVAIPARIPGARRLLASVVANSAGVVAAGEYTLAALEGLAGATGKSMGSNIIIPPGVDSTRFVPLEAEARERVRSSMGLGSDDFAVVGISRLVPRKGMDVLIRACSLASSKVPNLKLVVAGDGRQREKLKRLSRASNTEVRLLGRVSEERLIEVYQAGDLFAMPCRNRWFGLEQEGFGIVFLEAAACGVAQLAGASGGAGEAVLAGSTGWVLSRPSDPAQVADAIVAAARDAAGLAGMGARSRRRAAAEFDYDGLARRYGRHFGLGVSD